MSSNFLRFCLLFIYLLISTSHGCSYDCDLSADYRVCLDNPWGMVGPDCTGFIDCVNITQTCAGECQPEYPVMSKDGLSCTACQEDGGEDVTAKLCPQCKEGELWCKAEEVCKPKTVSCGGKCPSLLYPVLSVTQQECSPCSENSRWCKEEGRCFDLRLEPCNGECQSLGFRYCPNSKSCQEEEFPCGSIPPGEKQTGNSPRMEVKADENKGLVNYKIAAKGRPFPTTKTTTTKAGLKTRKTLKSTTRKTKASKPNFPVSNNNDLCSSKIDAIVQTSDGTSYVFKGDNYWMLTNGSVASGYPRRISQDWPGLPGNIDAALNWKTNRNTYFFKGDQFWKFTGQTPSLGYPKNITQFHGIPSNLDAAFEWGRNTYLYFLKGSQYWKYDIGLQTMSDGYPKQISSGWKNVPDNIDAALQWRNGKIYFFKAGKYSRLNAQTAAVDKSNPTFPRDAGHWWFGCPPEEKAFNKWISGPDFDTEN